MKYIRMRVLGIGAATMMILGLAGCGKASEVADLVPTATSEQSRETAEENSPTPSTAPTAATVMNESGTSESGDKANKLTYTAEQKKDILAAAQQAGLHTVYVPTIGGGPDDYFDSVTVDGNRLFLHFIRMGIAESNEEIELFGKDRIERKVQLTNDREGKWITEEESTVAFLYFQIDQTYFQIASAKTFDGQAFEVAAKSLVPLE